MIVIVGGGPAGSYLAHLLAEKGQEVTVVEEHAEIGSPVQCTGIVTDSISKFLDIPNSVISNRCERVVVVSKNNRVTANTHELVMWRNKFDQFVAEKAQKSGAQYLLNHQFLGFEGSKLKIKDKSANKIKLLEASHTVGADGPSSAVAKAAGLESKGKFYIGMQAKVKLKMPLEEFETYFGSDFPHFFGWVVPESEDTVRLGLGAFENAKDYFYKFLKERTGSDKIECWESGIFPLHDPQKVIQKNNIYLIGDAASQVKATTGGGIIPSLKAATTLADCITNNRDYQKEFAKASGRELKLHLKIRNTLKKFSDKDYDYLLELMNQDKVKALLKKYDRDTPIPLVKNLLLTEPRFLKYLKFAF